MDSEPAVSEINSEMEDLTSKKSDQPVETSKPVETSENGTNGNGEEENGDRNHSEEAEPGYFYLSYLFSDFIKILIEVPESEAPEHV